MNLTSSQRDAVSNDGNTLIVACPGSGKTRTLISKLLKCVEDIRNTPHKIACITYTNAAVHEIEYRLRCYGRSGDEEYCDISTIHSFCLVNILNFFHEHIPQFEGGFSVIPPDCEKYKECATRAIREQGYSSSLFAQFENIGRSVDGTPVTNADLPSEVVKRFWEIIEADGLIDFPSIVYYTYKLMLDIPSISCNLAAKYKWILVDEFQDTSSIQVQIFRHIAQHNNTSFFLVGDPLQSIYGFAGAQPGLLDEFSDEINANRDYHLTDNFRCSQAIIEHAERLCPRIPRMTVSGTSEGQVIEPVYVNTSTAFESITDHFIPALEQLEIPFGDAAILAPWWVKLYPLGKQLREYGIPVIGPGARPYKRSHLFATVAEQLCAYVTGGTSRMFRQLEKELFLLLNTLNGRKPFSLFSYEGRFICQKLVRIAYETSNRYEGGVEWLRQTVRLVTHVLTDMELVDSECSIRLAESVEDMISDMVKNRIDVENLSLADLGVFADTNNSIKLLTLHKAKGREFAAVAIIDLHDGRVPDYRALRDGDQDKIEEGRRLLYVGMTRAKKFLMYATDNEHPRNTPSRFLGNHELDLIRT